MSTTTHNKDDKLADVIGPTDPKEDRKAKDKLTSARVALLLKQPFFGNMATRLELTNADEWIPTAATDGRRFYYNSKFINMLDRQEVEFLFGHEVLHCCYDHIARTGERDRQLFNVACDYAVNRDLIAHRVGKMITTVDCLYDIKYDGMSAEQIYNELYENVDKVTIDELVDRVLDEHLEDTASDDGKGNNGSGNDSSKGPVKISKEDRQAIKDEIKEAMMQAAEAAGADNTPESIRRAITTFTKPQMDWRDLLRQTIESTIKDDFSWQRTSRRGWHIDAILPGMTPGEETDVVVAVDTSGSISNKTLELFLSEVKGIMESFTTYKVHLFCFDTSVHNPQTFTSDNLADISEYELNGYGGTDFNCVFSYLVNEGIEPQRLIMFTDGYPWSNEWGNPDYCETLFVIHGSTTIEAPYGVTTYYNDQA